MQQPIAFTDEEGGNWQRWEDREKFSTPGKGIRIHSLMFADGLRFDAYNGFWRPADEWWTKQVKSHAE